MSDDWDFYLLRVDDAPASIYLDLGLARDAPINGQPHMAYVRIFMRQPRPDGLSSKEEFDDLIGVENSLTELFAGGDKTTYAGRNTSSGTRDFYFYTADPTAFAQSVEGKMAHHPTYRFDVGARLDPEWEVYFDFLHPSRDDMQRIYNRRVVENLEAHGDSLSVPRPIDHLAYLPNEASATELRAYLGEQNFSVEEPRVEDDSVAISFKRSDPPESIDEVVIPLVRHIEALGGEYDGWGCELVY